MGHNVMELKDENVQICSYDLFLEKLKRKVTLFINKNLFYEIHTDKLDLAFLTI